MTMIQVLGKYMIISWTLGAGNLHISGFRVQGSDSEVRALRFSFLGLSHQPDLPVVQLAAPVILPACPVLQVPASNPAAQR